MPILTYFNNMFYGSASAAMVDESVATTSLDIKGNATIFESVQIELPTPYLKPTRLVNSPLIVQGLGEMQEATPKGRGRMALDVRVNQLTQDDVTGAVLEAKVEGTMTLKSAIRLILSVLAGKTSITDLGEGEALVKFRDIADTKDRISASMTGSERTNVTLNTD